MRNFPQVRDIGLVANGPVQLPAASDEAASLGNRPPSATQWLCAQHRAFKGRQASFALRRAGFEVHWPRLLVQRTGRNEELQPLFPGYLFVRIDPGQSWSRAHRAEYVLGLVGVRETSKPLQAPAGFVGALIARAGAIDLPIDETPEALAFRTGKPEAAPLPSGMVRILGGPFDGLTGLIREDRGDERVRVLLEIMGGSREAAVPRSMVEVVS